jgi:DNA repair protein RecO (recombination protein O)
MSNRIRVSLEPAWILHHYPYRETSLLVEVFTRQHGRTGLVARGVRSAKARWHGHLQILRPLLLSWSIRGELGTLTGVESRKAVKLLPGRKVLSACYLNELLMRLLTRHDPHSDLFTAYEQAIQELESGDEPVLRVFEKRLLQALGYGLLLGFEADSGNPVERDGWYEYQLERGPVPCAHKKEEGIYLHGSSLLALQDDNLSDALACKEVKRLMRAALGLYLGSRPLKTREVLRQLASLSQNSLDAQATVN